MDLVQAIVLGIVEGLTEYLPISSSGHLIIARWLFGSLGVGDDLAFDVALNVGGILAVLVYFARDFWVIGVAFLRGLLARGFQDDNARLGAWILIGTLPAAIIGLAIQDIVETTFRDVRVVAISLIVVGVVMWFADRLATQKRDERSLTLVDTVLIGFAQAIALIPGVSRSGITMSAALARGLNRASAARFSFLLATPVILAAGLVQAVKLARSGIPASELMTFAVGITTAAIVGYLSIAFLLRYLRDHSLTVFVVYRIVVGIIVLVVAQVRG